MCRDPWRCCSPHLDLATLFLPQADRGLLIRTHDDVGIRAADEVAALGGGFFLDRSKHCVLHRGSKFDSPVRPLQAELDDIRIIEHDMKSSKTDQKVNMRLLPLTSGQIRAARAFLRWTAEDLAHSSALSVATIRRAELTEEATMMTTANDLAVRRALEAAGVEFIDANGGGPGVRLRESKS
jgi:hypothetical protein